ncbi:MAG: helix-turn-helix transcriptional regulator, partial [Lachnospiraceae bacterium]|nr:helix-turn-helix transcriptional regulator [Lachnospiraceae bacterium]
MVPNSEKNFSLDENLKKAVTEVLLLHLLSDKDCYIGELTAIIREKSNGILNIAFPYSAIYRLQQSGYLVESEKRLAPDGRRRQYYRITKAGRDYLYQLKEI